MYITIWYDLQECGNFTWRVSDCEELLGITQIYKVQIYQDQKCLQQHNLENIGYSEISIS